MIYAGDFARQGIATITIDMPDHGIYLDTGNRALASAELAPKCLAPWVDAIATGRETDGDADGALDSPSIGGRRTSRTRATWSPGHPRRDASVRIMRAFGTMPGKQDFNNDGTPEILGDFDADGTADVAGTAPIYVAGESLGGIMGEILGGAEPYIQAAAPMSGGGGLVDIAFRSYGITEAVVLQQVSPFIFSVPASARPADKDGT